MRNIEETEAAKKLLQEKRLGGRAKSEFSIPSSFSADYFQRGRDYAEKLRRGSVAFSGDFYYGSLLVDCLICDQSMIAEGNSRFWAIV